MVHIPVLKDEILFLLDLKPGDRVIDGTLDGGGHTQAMLEKIAPTGKVLGIEQDEKMIEALKSKIESAGWRTDTTWKNLVIAHGNFREIDSIAQKNNFDAVQAILFDLGMSTWHLKESGRGFSFQKPEEPLLMNLNPAESESAASLLSSLPEAELAKVLREYGEERRSRFIARTIAMERKKKKIRSVRDLLDILKTQDRKTLARIFQALRIAVNDELTSLGTGIEKGFQLLAPEGMFAIISYHSLEDRIVKQIFNTYKQREEGILMTKKPITPAREETLQNPSSRSANLRIIKKI